MSSSQGSTINDCVLISLPQNKDLRGSLCFIESGKHLPFDLRRVFYIYDIPQGESRGAHAHRQQHQFLLCLAGAYQVALDDGKNKKIISLKNPAQGLHVPPGVWAAEINFEPGSVILVLASDAYQETDYIRDYAEFLSFKLSTSGK